MTGDLTVIDDCLLFSYGIPTPGATGVRLVNTFNGSRENKTSLNEELRCKLKKSRQVWE